MIGKKINQLATELAPASTDLTIIGNPTTGVSKKITLAQLGAIFSGAVSFYTNLASFPATGTLDVIFCAKDTQKLYLWSGSAYVEVFPSQALLDTYQIRSEKGNANGYASLDSSGKVPVSQLPSSIMEYKGTWSAATNTPTLANGTGDTGDVYICNAAGSVNFGAGAITFAVGDYVIYSGSIWQRSSGAVGTVTSVAASITGNAIGITGSPVTTSGTLALAFAGTSAQYVNGAGNLVTFPSIISQAQNIVSEVYNNTGATLTKGTIVYINGGQGNLPTVTKALATGDSTSAQTYGIVQADITNMNNGYVVVTGRLIDLDTQAYSNGTQLYLSGTTAGTWTSTKPYAPIHLVYVGIVVRSHPTQGIVEVKIQNGYELDEIHNVAAQTPTNNDGLFWEASTSLWKNKSIATVLGYTPQAQLNGTGFVKASGTTITYDNSTYLTTSAAATTYLPMVLSSTAKSIELNGQTFDVSSVAGSYTSGRLIVTPIFTAIGYQVSGVFKGLQISTDGTANFYNTGLTRFFNQVQFDSTLTNGTYTYTLPGATGTLALTSDIPSLSGYVPYTGATTNLNLGSNNLTAAAITGSSARITTLAGSVYADVNGNLGTTAGTQNTIAYWGSQYSLASLSTTTYPDLTELSYVKGVTSSIQTQLNSKQSTLTNPVTGTGTTNYLPKFTGTSTIGNSLVYDNGTNVGIGVGTSSGARLSILNIAANPFLELRSTNNVYQVAKITFDESTDKMTIMNNQSYSLSGIAFGTNGTEKMFLNVSGNLGLGVTPSAWSNSGNLDLQDVYLSLSSQGAYGGTISNNAYYNVGWKYKGANYATQYQTLAGEHRWLTAGVGAAAGNAISFTQAMTLDASGRLGIGTTTLTERLNINGVAKWLPISVAPIWDTSTYIWMQDGFGSRYDGYQHRFDVGSSRTQALLINSTGAATFSNYVTIGNSSTTPAILTLYPSASAKGWQITANNYIGSALEFTPATSNGGTTFTTPVLTIASTGAATFSSSVTATSFAVGASVNYNAMFYTAGANASYIQMANGSTGAGSGNGMIIGVDANGNGIVGVRGAFDYITSVAGVERMRISSNGSVGIGTTSPQVLLQVGEGSLSNNTVNQYLRVNAGVYNAASTSNLDLFNFGNNFGNALGWRLTSGTEGVGVSVGRYLSFNTVVTDGSGNPSTATERMRITSGGNVGIGTSNAYTRLRVDGDISAEYSSTIYLDYALSPNSYKKGFSGVNQSTGSARGLHIFNYDADSNGGINFWLGTNSARTHAAIITNAGNVEINTGSIKTGEPDTGYGRAAFKIGSRQTGSATGTGGYIPISIDGTVYFINLYTSTP